MGRGLARLPALVIGLVTPMGSASGNALPLTGPPKAGAPEPFRFAASRPPPESPRPGRKPSPRRPERRPPPRPAELRRLAFATVTLVALLLGSIFASAPSLSPEDEAASNAGLGQAFGATSFEVPRPPSVGVLPLVPLTLWAFALGAILYSFVRQPPDVQAQTTLHAAGRVAQFATLLVVLFLWDKSFEQTLGSSVFALARDEGISSATLPRLGLLAALELGPWTIAAILFAVPVRMALGVGLRYLGRGRSFTGIASAGGLVSLGAFGPMHAIWCFDLLWSGIGGRFGL